MFLMDEEALRKRLNVVYAQMRESAKPKLYKNGRHKGHIRIPGIVGLPFTREQFWQEALAQVGPSAVQCPYCVEIGKPANLITLANCVFDHKVPRARAGAELTVAETWSLTNIVAVCRDCNNLKGKLSYPFFIGLMSAIERWDDPRDRDSVYACLRTHGVTLQSFRIGRKPLAPAEDVPTTGILQLQEDF